jgi:PTS system cellobiose-specific IIB component
MRKIVLLCAAGMSTSALVRKMKDAAKDEGYDCDISAHSVAEAKNYADADIILLGPQVRYRLQEVQKLLPDNKVEVIDMKDYGMMNGKAVLDHARTVMEG